MTTVSPHRIMHEPFACPAYLPVSTVTFLPPISVWKTLHSIKYLSPNNNDLIIYLNKNQGGAEKARPLGCRLFTQFELGYQRAVTLNVYLFKIVELTAARADHLKKTSSRMVILGVRFKMLRKVVDAPCKERDLNLGATRIAFVRCKFGDYLRFDLFVHVYPPTKFIRLKLP